MNLAKSIALLALSIVATLVSGDALGEFEQRHMNDAHQIEVDDEATFFKLHDLDGDGFWDEKELQSMYGLERDIDPNTSHIKHIIDRVYQEMDMNKDRFISQDEYIIAKLPSLSPREEVLETDFMKNAIPQYSKRMTEEAENAVPNKYRA